MTKSCREANWKDRIMYAVGKRKIFRVQGDSMLPTLKDGDACDDHPDKIDRARRCRPGDHPYKYSVKILKRVTEIDDETADIR